MTALPVRAFVRDTYGHWAAPIVTRFALHAALPADEPFRPDAPVTRAELAQLLVLAAAMDGQARELQGVDPVFVDVSASHPLASYAQVVFEHGWLIGDGTRLEPDRPITRAELAVVLSRIYGLIGDGAAPLLMDDAPAAGAPATAPGTATVFRDDADIPGWAREAVAAAVAHGLVNGFPDGSFRPAETATRAQAVTLLQAMLFRRSDAFTVIGPVDGYDGPTRTITIAGQPWQFAHGALLLRGDTFISPFQLPPTDLLRGLADKDGRLVYAESVPLEDLAVLAGTGPDPNTLTVTPLGFIDWQHWLSSRPAPRTGRSDWQLGADASVFRNGQQATLHDLRPGDRLYVRRDARDGSVMVVDAVQVDVNGYIAELQPADQSGRDFELTFSGTAGERHVTANLTAESVVYIDGARADAGELRAGDRVVVHLGPAIGGASPPVKYLEATR